MVSKKRTPFRYRSTTDDRPQTSAPPNSVEAGSDITPEQRKQAIYERLRQAKMRYGMIRLEMGVLLDQIHQEKIWDGRASSFAAFLEEERINSRAGYEYMRVARKFFTELKLTDEDFRRISTTSMSILALAAQVADAENKDQIIDYVSVLSERDARQVLLEMHDEVQPEGSQKPKRSRQINRAIDAYRQLPDDQRIEFLQTLGR